MVDINSCYLCGKPLQDDITREHFIPRCILHKYNKFSMNVFKAHEQCNKLKGSMLLLPKLVNKELFPINRRGLQFIESNKDLLTYDGMYMVDQLHNALRNRIDFYIKLKKSEWIVLPYYNIGEQSVQVMDFSTGTIRKLF